MNKLLIDPSSEDSKEESSGLGNGLRDLGDWLPEPSYLRALAVSTASNPRFWKGLALVIVLFVATSYGPGWLEWAGEQGRRGASAVAGAADDALPSERAAYRLTTSYDAVVDSAAAADQPTIVPGSAGRAEYRVDFAARLDQEPVRWAVKADDPDNYYVFELTRGRGGHSLKRWAVVAGVAENDQAEAVEIAAESLADGANTVTSIVRSHSVTTLINGYGVDYFRDDRLLDGGIGFFSTSADDEASPIADIVLRGNEDDWGRFLAAAHDLLSNAS